MVFEENSKYTFVMKQKKNNRTHHQKMTNKKIKSVS